MQWSSLSPTFKDWNVLPSSKLIWVLSTFPADELCHLLPVIDYMTITIPWMPDTFSKSTYPSKFLLVCSEVSSEVRAI